MAEYLIWPIGKPNITRKKWVIGDTDSNQIEKEEWIVPLRLCERKERTEKRKVQHGQRESLSREGKICGRLVGAANTSRELAEWRSIQQQNLITLGLPNRKRWS